MNRSLIFEQKEKHPDTQSFEILTKAKISKEK